MRLSWMTLLLSAPTVICQLQIGGAAPRTQVDYVYRPRGSPATGGGSPFSGVVPGVLLMAGSTGLLWWNEGRTARHEQVLRAATRQRLESLDGSAAFDAANAGSLVHIRASTVLPGGGVQDPLFRDVRRPGALRLRRRSETFQWEETAHTSEERVSETHVKRTTTYSYHQRWSDRHVDSSSFRGDRGSHRNTAPRVPPGTLVVDAQAARLPNGVPLEPALIDQLSSWQPVRLSPDDATASGDEVSDGGVALQPIVGALIGPLDGSGADALYFGSANAPPLDEREGAHVVGGRAVRPKEERLRLPAQVETYMGAAHSDGAGALMPRLAFPPTPRVGDSRVHFEEVESPRDGLSILAELGSDRRLRPWRPAAQQHGDASGPSIYMLSRGDISAKRMIETLRQGNARVKWLLRAGGAGLMWAGLAMGLSWIPAILSRAPLLGGVAASLAGASIGVASFFGALGAASLAVAIAWARFRPVHSAGLLACISALYYGLAQAPHLLGSRGGRLPPVRRRAPSSPV